MTNHIEGFDIFSALISSAHHSLLSPEDLTLLQISTYDCDPDDLSATDLALAGEQLRTLSCSGPGATWNDQAARIAQFLHGRLHAIMRARFTQALQTQHSHHQFEQIGTQLQRFRAPTFSVSFNHKDLGKNTSRYTLITSGTDGQETITNVLKTYRGPELRYFDDTENIALRTAYRDAGSLNIDRGSESARITFRSVSGDVHTATVAQDSPFPAVARYLEVLLQAQFETGSLGKAHTAMFRPLTSAQIADLLHNAGYARFGPGAVFTTEEHGGGILYQLIRDPSVDRSTRFRTTQTSTTDAAPASDMEVGHVTIGQLLDGYQYALTMPPPDSYKKFPYIDSSDVDGFELDAYAFLSAAMRLMPIEEWDRPWKTHTGICYSLNEVMEGAAAAYLRRYQPFGVGDSDHSSLHLPALISRWYIATEQDPHYFKQFYISQVIAQYVSNQERFKLSQLGHALENLGEMASMSEITWDADDIFWLQALISVIKTRTIYASASDLDDAEFSHALRGAHLLARHYPGLNR